MTPTDQESLFPPDSGDQVGGAAADPTPRRTARWGEQASVLQSVLQVALEREGEPAERAAILAESVLLSLCEYAGGRDFYLPKATLLKASLRDRRIVDEFNGRNWDDLARRYQVSTRWVREILTRDRELRRRKNR